MLKILELFGGIGAPRKALENLGINLKSIDYVEILPYAVDAYNKIFDNSYAPQDIRTWNMNVDLLVHGSPCQDWSKNGLNNVNSGRSILYERTLEIIEKELHPRPKVVVWENVTGLVSKRHISHFNHYLASMEKMGYQNSFKILNSKDYGTPQSRERIFTISVLGENTFEFPEPVSLKKKLLDYIDYDVDPEEYSLTQNEKKLFFQWEKETYVHANNKSRFTQIFEGDSVNVERPNSKTRRGRVQREVVPTLTTSPHIAVFYNDIIRKLSPKECWRLMGFTDEDFNRVLSAGIPNASLYHLQGNSIVVSVLEAIFKQLIKQEIITVNP